MLIVIHRCVVVLLVIATHRGTGRRVPRIRPLVIAGSGSVIRAGDPTIIRPIVRGIVVGTHDTRGDIRTSVDGLVGITTVVVRIAIIGIIVCGSILISRAVSIALIGATACLIGVTGILLAGSAGV